MKRVLLTTMSLAVLLIMVGSLVAQPSVAGEETTISNLSGPHLRAVPLSAVKIDIEENSPDPLNSTTHIVRQANATQKFVLYGLVGTEKASLAGYNITWEITPGSYAIPEGAVVEVYLPTQIGRYDITATATNDTVTVSNTTHMDITYSAPSLIIVDGVTPEDQSIQVETISDYFAVVYDDYGNPIPPTRPDGSASVILKWDSINGYTSLVTVSADYREATFRAGSKIGKDHIRAAVSGSSGDMGYLEINVTPDDLRSVELETDQNGVVVGKDITFRARGLDKLGNDLNAEDELTRDLIKDTFKDLEWNFYHGSTGDRPFVGFVEKASYYYATTKTFTLDVNQLGSDVSDGERLTVKVEDPDTGDTLGSFEISVSNPYYLAIDTGSLQPRTIPTGSDSYNPVVGIRYSIPPELQVAGLQKGHYRLDLTGTFFGNNLVLDSASENVISGTGAVRLRFQSISISAPSKRTEEFTLGFSGSREHFDNSEGDNSVEVNATAVGTTGSSVPSFEPSLALVMSMLGVITFLGAYSRGREPSRVPRRFGGRSDNRGVSPVIGVILIVAITVLLISVLYVWIASLIGGEKGSEPVIDVQVRENSFSDYMVEITDIRYGDRPSLSNFEIYLRDPDSSTVLSLELDDLVGCAIFDSPSLGTPGTVDDPDDHRKNPQIEFRDNDMDGHLSDGDAIAIKSRSNDGIGMSHGTLILLYEPTLDPVVEADLIIS